MATPPTSKIKPEVALLGLAGNDLSFLNATFSHGQIAHHAIDLEKLLEPMTPTPCVVLCGAPPDGVPIAEMAQAIRMNHQDIPLYILWYGRSGYDRKAFLKNGFTDAFLIPVDIPAMQKAITDVLVRAGAGGLRTYRSVKLIDIQPGAKINFDAAIHLPTNNKYITLVASGDEVDQTQLDKLKKHQVNKIHVPNEQIKHFYDYTAKTLRDLGNSGAMSETEKKEKVQEAVRNLMGGMFAEGEKDGSFDQGKTMLADCQEIVKSYVMTGEGNNEWYARLETLSGESADTYSHAVNVSTYAAMFSMALGIGKAEDLALAGLLHDIGKADIPATVLMKSELERNAEETKLYESHPDLSVALIKARRMIVSDSITKAILQHHEKYGGKGYPKSMPGDRIFPDAQVLALADRFDYLTAMQENGGKGLTPLEALKFLQEEADTLPSDELHYNPDLLKRLCQTFMQREPETSTTAAPPT